MEEKIRGKDEKTEWSPNSRREEEELGEGQFYVLERMQRLL